MSYVFDENTNKTDIIILDAQNFQGDPVAVILLPVRVPYGFHGNWIADSDLQTV
jgi:carotenoid cleavage dioxygenase-like enzyme